MFNNLLGQAQRFIEEKKKQLKPVVSSVQKKFQPITSGISRFVSSFKAPPVSPPLRNIPKTITQKPVVKPISKPLFTPVPRPVYQTPKPAPVRPTFLQSAKDFVKKKVTEPFVSQSQNILKQQAQGSPTPFFTTLKSIPQEIAKKVQPFVESDKFLGGYFKPTPQVRTRDVIREIPGKIIDFLSPTEEAKAGAKSYFEGKTLSKAQKKAINIEETFGALGMVSPLIGKSRVAKPVVKRILKGVVEKSVPIAKKEAPLFGKQIVKTGEKLFGKVKPQAEVATTKAIQKLQATGFKTPKDIWKAVKPPVEGGVLPDKLKSSFTEKPTYKTGEIDLQTLATGKGWGKADRGIIPGEPELVYKNKVAITSVENEMQMSMFEVVDNNGNLVGRYSDPRKAIEAAKFYVDKSVVEEGVIVGKEIVKKGIKKITPLLEKPGNKNQVVRVPSKSIVAPSLPKPGLDTNLSPSLINTLSPAGASKSIRYVDPSQVYNFADPNIYSNYNKMSKISQENKSIFTNNLEQATGIKSDVRIKTKSSFNGKIERYKIAGKDPSTIADTLAGRVVTNESNINSTISNIDKNFKVIEVQNFFDKPSDWGYQGVNIKVELSNGLYSEIQIHTPESLSIVKKIHPLYEKWRNIDINKLTPQQISLMKNDRLKSLNIGLNVQSTPPLSPIIKPLGGGDVRQVIEQGLVKPKPTLFGKQVATKVEKPLFKSKKLPPAIPPSNAIQETKYAFNINKQRLAIPEKSKQFLDKTVNEIKPQLEAVKGKTLKNEEVIKAAQTSDMLRKVINREQTLQVEAQLLRLRQFVAEAAKNETVTPEFVEGLRVLSSQAADIGRTLQSFAIKAEGIGAPGIKELLIKDLLTLGKKTDEIVNAAKGIDFNDLKQVTQFYRQFVKPTVPELIDEYRYINLLSSPQTQIVNAFSNLLQATIQAPITKLFSGAVDKIQSVLTGADRTRYVSEVPAYYKGAINSIGEGFTKFTDVMKGKSLIERPDLARIPTGGIAPNKALQPMTWFTQKFQVIPRFMEGMDVLFRNIIKGGELESLLERAAKSGKQVDDIMLSKLQQEAEKKAQYFVFRAPVDATTKSGQGHLLRTIDQATSWIYQGRKIPGVKWFIPFVQTPMNILKQGIEYSPAGLFTLPGAVDKTEQLGKALMGSTVFMGAAYLIASNDSSWSAPISKKEKEAFYASGRQPYSIKIGDAWVSYNRLGPLAYPIAMAAAVKYYMEQDPKATTTEGYKKVANVIGGIARFFSDQSYMQGLGDFIKLLEADPRAVAEIVSNIPTQLIPLTSLLGWVNRNFLDPVYRNPKNIPEEIMLNIPFLSGGIEPYLNPKGQPSVRKNILFNAFSPVRVTPSDEEFNQLFKTQLEVSKVEKQKTKQKETDIKRIMPLYEQAQVLKQTDINAAEDLVNNLSDEDYKVYKSIKKTEQNKKTAAKKIEMFPVVRRVQELLKQGNRQEAERLVKELTDEEYVGYVKAKKELGIGEQPTGQPLFAQ